MRYLTDFDSGQTEIIETDFLVIGSGVAGLTTAIESANAGRVTIITKDEIAEGSTWHAQGGIAVSLADGDEPEFHMEDTLKAGVGLCSRKAVKILVEEGVTRVEELISWGAKFDMEKGHLSFTQEGAHKIRRIIHAMGDATGEEVHKTLTRKARETKNIRFMSHTFLIDLITKGNECIGALTMSKNGRLRIISACATILASGGIGQLYRNTTNPPVATGDGLAAAWRAGCEIQDMEFIQFHPTTLYLPRTPCFLISESARGEGGILKNSNGEVFMEKYHEMGDLAPRDVVSRAIFNQMWRTKSNTVFLDMRHLKSGFLKKRFPNIFSTCKQYGIDISKKLIPVRPTAHFLMGGVKTNLSAETNIKRLLSCGESASVGVHGANRLASNSLLEGLVFGKRAGISASKYLRQASPHFKKTGRMKVRTTAKSGTGKIKMAIKKLMEEKAGIIRCEKSLKESLVKLQEWDKILKPACSREELELKNMTTVACMVTSSALKRKESRGAHYRSDFPDINNRSWKKHTVLKNV